MADFFWSLNGQLARMDSLLLQYTRGKPRVGEQRMLSGIAHALKSRGRCGVCLEHVYGPKKKLYHRFRRRACRGVGQHHSRPHDLPRSDRLQHAQQDVYNRRNSNLIMGRQRPE